MRSVQQCAEEQCGTVDAASQSKERYNRFTRRHTMEVKEGIGQMGKEIKKVIFPSILIVRPFAFLAAQHRYYGSLVAQACISTSQLQHGPELRAILSCPV